MYKNLKEILIIDDLLWSKFCRIIYTQRISCSKLNITSTSSLKISLFKYGAQYKRVMEEEDILLHRTSGLYLMLCRAFINKLVP